MGFHLTPQKVLLPVEPWGMRMQWEHPFKETITDHGKVQTHNLLIYEAFTPTVWCGTAYSKTVGRCVLHAYELTILKLTSHTPCTSLKMQHTDPGPGGI